MSEQPPAGYGYNAPPPPQPGPGGVRPGELMDRFLARLIDSVILWFVGFIIGSVIIVGALMGARTGVVGAGTSWAASAVTSIISTLIYLGYFAFMESSRGQTIGKMVMKLRTEGPSGGNPTLEQAVKRNIFMAIGLLGLIPILGWIASPILSIIAVVMIAVGINNDTVNRQAWHDHFAGGTRVLKIG